METALQTISDLGALPMAKEPVLLTGKIKIANDLVAAFANDEGESRRMAVVWDAAFNVKFSAIELEENLSRAIVMAKEMDVREGFKPAEGAKGVKKYGPRQFSMSVRASEIRQLFGALVHTKAAATSLDDGQSVLPLIEKSCGFTKAVKLARMALKDSCLQWDGTQAKTDAQKDQERTQRVINDTREEWVKQHPQQAGESFGAYAERMNSAVEMLSLENMGKQQEEQVAKDAQAFIKKQGLVYAAEIAEHIITEYNRHVDAQAAVNAAQE